MKLTVVIADDNPAVLRRLTSLLEPEFVVVGSAENGRAALECVRQHRPDVVVLDLEMPVLNGIETTKELKKMSSPPAVVVCSVETDPEIIETARQNGASGYVFKLRMARDLVNAVKAVARGEVFVSPSSD